ncbi:MAG TPA: sugar ABC transporter substrate-binding protein [Clostridia bacterium]
MKRTISIILMLVLVATLLPACAQTTPAATTKAGTTAVGTTAVGTTAAATTAGPVKKVQLTWWHYFVDASYTAYASLVKEYNALGTAKATIVEQYIPRNDLLKQLTLGVVSNELPDLAMVDNPDSCSFEAMGLFVDITDKFNAWSDNKFQAGPLSSGAYKGKQYTLPMRSNSLALWTNDAMFKTAGITKMPTTWAELDATCATLLAKTPSVYPLVFSAIKSENGTFQFLPFLQSAGGDVNNLGSAEGIKALTYITSLAKNKYVSAECINWAQADVEKQFAAGNAAMMVNGPWQIPQMKIDAPNLKYTVTALPMDKKYSTSLGGENVGITKSCKNVDIAWEFTTWFLSTPNNIKFNIAGGTVSPHSNATPEQQYPNDPVWKVFIESLSYAVTRGPHPKWPELSAAIQEAIQQSITGAKTPTAAATDAAAKIKVINDSLK